jgi:hypothetical protein
MIQQLKNICALWLCAMFFISSCSNVTNASAPGNMSYPAFEKDTTVFENKAWYQLSIGNTTVGLISVSIENTDTGYPFNYNAQFISRVGPSPVWSMLSGQALPEGSKNDLIFTQTLKTKINDISYKDTKNTWKIKGGEGVLLPQENPSGASLSRLLPVVEKDLFLKTNGKEMQGHLFYRPRGVPEDVFVPLTGTFMRRDTLAARYDKDGFLASAHIPLENGFVLEITNVEKDRFDELFQTHAGTLIDFGWFYSLHPFSQEVESLRIVLNDCVEKTDDLSKRILKQIPQSSYLSYRKIINVSSFCSQLKHNLTAARMLDQAAVSKVLSDGVQRLFKDYAQELPDAISMSPDGVLFYNQTLSLLWPRVATSLIQGALVELEYSFE